MANEIKVQYQTGESDVYACVFNNSKQVYDITGSNWEQWDDAQIDRYDVPLAENGGGGIFFGDFPAAIGAGEYSIVAYQGDKTAPDVTLGSGAIIWDGTAEITISGKIDALNNFNPASDTVTLGADGLDIISLSSGDIDSLKNTVDTNLDVTVSSRSNHTAANVKTSLETDGSKLDHVWETTEDDDGVRRFTENALEQAPTAEMDQEELHAALDAYVAAGGDFDAIKKLLRADKKIDKEKSPWVTDYYAEGTTVSPLMSKKMYDPDGNPITNINNVLGRLEKEA